MPHRRFRLRLLVPISVIGGVVACADPVAPRPLGVQGALLPKPRLPGGTQVDTTLLALPEPLIHPGGITISGLPPTAKITVGVAVTLTATALDSAGATLSSMPAVWSVSDTSLATVGASTGVLTATKPGSFRVGATVGDTTAWLDVAAVASTPTVPAPTSASPSSIAIAVVRFDGGSGPATVSSGIPLMPGALLPGQEGAVRVFVGGLERPAHVAGLHSLHPDGSLRSILVQFKLDSLDAAPDTGTVVIGTPRVVELTLADRLVTPGATGAGAPAGVPQAAALPSDPTYLVATDLVGPTLTSAETKALGGAFARYESDFEKHADTHWARDGAGWQNANYYDRALIYYAFWARTGNPTYWSRATQLAYDYRTRYLQPANFAPSAHWAQLEGLEKHYLLTADSLSRVGVIRAADVMNLANADLHASFQTRTGGESRISARTLHAALLAWRLTPTGAPVVRLQSQVQWATRLERRINEQVAWQMPDGSFPSDVAVCGGQLNYMVGLLNDALIKTYEYYKPDPRIEQVVTRSVDYLWNTQWVSGKNAFQYASVACPMNLLGFGVGSPSPAGDLNNMLSAGFGWVYKRTANPAYRDAGDAVFSAGVGYAYLVGQKQFNEAYTSSFRYLGYR